MDDVYLFCTQAQTTGSHLGAHFYSQMDRSQSWDHTPPQDPHSDMETHTLIQNRRCNLQMIKQDYNSSVERLNGLTTVVSRFYDVWYNKMLLIMIYKLYPNP